jgi:hydrogenase maturation protease
MRPGDGPVLVIGYGNPLRGDDAVGQRVAEAVARLGLAHVEVRTVHQLTPELAEPLASARLAVFVDATLAAEGAPVEAKPLAPALSPPALGHTGDPGYLLALAQALTGRHPPAWWVQVPGVRFQLGEELSPTAAAGMAEALRVISRLVRTEVPAVR